MYLEEEINLLQIYDLFPPPPSPSLDYNYWLEVTAHYFRIYDKAHVSLSSLFFAYYLASWETSGMDKPDYVCSTDTIFNIIRIDQ